MGRDPNEKHTSNPGNKPRKGNAPAKAWLYTYHPTEAHKVTIRELCRDTNGLLDSLISALGRGVTVKLRFREDFGAFECQARKGEGDWRSIPTASTYHSGADVALASLMYFLVDLYPGWPENGPQTFQGDLEW